MTAEIPYQTIVREITEKKFTDMLLDVLIPRLTF